MGREKGGLLLGREGGMDGLPDLSLLPIPSIDAPGPMLDREAQGPFMKQAYEDRLAMSKPAWWEKNGRRRKIDVDRTKRSDKYIWYMIAQNNGLAKWPENHPPPPKVSPRFPPDPRNQSISKRHWQSLIDAWRRELTAWEEYMTTLVHGIEGEKKLAADGGFSELEEEISKQIELAEDGDDDYHEDPDYVDPYDNWIDGWTTNLTRRFAQLQF